MTLTLRSVMPVPGLDPGIVSSGCRKVVDGRNPGTSPGGSGHDMEVGYAFWSRQTASNGEDAVLADARRLDRAARIPLGCGIEIGG